MLRRGSRVAIYISSVLLFWFVAAPPAHAYIDPGSSGFIIQMLVGAAAGAALAVATFWRRIRLFFARVFGRGNDEPSSTASAPESETPPPPTA
jgi:hypothetical protein